MSGSSLTDTCNAIVTVVDNLVPVIDGCSLIQVGGPGRSSNNMLSTPANFRRVELGTITDNCSQ